MARIIIYDTQTGHVLKYLKSANTPDFEGRADVLINPDLSGFIDGLGNLNIDKSGIRVESQALRIATDAELQAEADLKAQQALVMTFEEMPLKLPGLAWQLIEGIGFTEEEKKIVIKSLTDFYNYIYSGYVQMAVTELNATPAPEGVDATKWATLLSQVNYVMGLSQS